MNLRLGWPACLVLIASACASAPPRAAVVPSGPSHAEGGNRKSMLRRILPQNVRIFVFEGKEARRSASGVVIGSESTPDGCFSYVLTSAHVVDSEGLDDPRMVVYVDRDGDSFDYTARSVAVGKVPDLDLALIKVRGVSLAAAQLADDAELEPGEDVLVVAAPYGKSLSISGGLISQVEWDRQSRVPAMLKTDAAIGYGASGGGVYSATSGKLLAIVEGYRTARVGFAVAEQSYSFDVPMPGETFAAPSAKVRAFLEKSGFGRFVAARASPGVEATRAALR
ncbi:MAG TPA: serine protease [Myxococcaceae bacterium]|nr:serine protease [Myxococcaceae bacterium]